MEFITRLITIAKKKKQQLFDVKEKADPNKMTVKIDPLKRPKMTPEELMDHWKANRGTGAHKNPADKRSNNPQKNIEDY